ncbi:Uncharacterised protein [Streptococcus pneumoniae]|nr:Uncharacterised protein [Streptococcus pneumoniae]
MSLETLPIPFYLIRQEVPLRLKMLISKMELHQPIQKDKYKPMIIARQMIICLIFEGVRKV